MLVFIFCKYEKVFSGSYPFAEGRISHVKVKRHWKDYMLWLLGLDTARREVLRTEGRRCQHSGKGNVVSLCFGISEKRYILHIFAFFQQCLISRTGSVTKQFESGFAMAAFPLLGYSWLQQTSRHIQRQDGRWGTTRVVFNILDCSLCWHQHSCCIGN